MDGQIKYDFYDLISTLDCQESEGVAVCLSRGLDIDLWNTLFVSHTTPVKILIGN